MGLPGRGACARTVSDLAVGLTLVLVVTGCGAQVERQQAGASADAFSAGTAGEPAAACALLAPRTLESLEEDGMACPQALARAGIPTSGEHTAVTVAGHSAQVRYPEQTVFLSLFDDGWRVTAAGCVRTSSDPAVPYDCTIEGD